MVAFLNAVMALLTNKRVIAAIVTILAAVGSTLGYSWTEESLRGPVETGVAIGIPVLTGVLGYLLTKNKKES